MLVSIIAAIGENRELGKNNKLLWHIPEDFARFKKITSFHPVIMGRTTFYSIGKPLPNRLNIIVTRQLDLSIPDCKIAHSVEEAISMATRRDKNEIFIIGGGQIYEQGIKYADKLYLTVVKGKFDADTFFPDYSKGFRIISESHHKNQNYEYSFVELEKS